MIETASLNELAKHLAALTESASALSAQFTESEWRKAYAPGKWKKVEVLGHLIDSAAHNHQRFARAMHEESITAPGYEGGPQVQVQRYAEAPIRTLVDAWSTYNRLLSFVLAHIPIDKEQTPCCIGTSMPMTLRELAFDYVAHLEHHLRQMFTGSDTLRYSGMPWPPAGRWQIQGSTADHSPVE